MMASSEVSTLFYLLQQSLSNQEKERKDAEYQLDQASGSGSFGLMLLQVATAVDADPSVKQAAAVYFKNYIQKRYDPYDEKQASISEEEKAQLKQSIIAAILSSGHQVRPQLITATHKIIRADFPKRWPQLIGELAPLLSTDNADHLIATLAIFHEVVSWHSGSTSEEVREAVHGNMFSILLSILTSRLEGALQNQPESVAICKSILKSFYSAICYRFSSQILASAAFTQWCTIITRIIQAPAPTSILSLSGEEAVAHLYWKMKKWCFHIHNKIFMRFGCTKLDTYNSDNKAFATFYMDQVALPVLNVYLEQIQLHLQGKNPFTPRIFCMIVDFLESASRPKKMWAVLETDIQNIIAHFIFPRLCFTEEDGEMWEDDPEEYVRVKLDPFDELYSEQSTGVNFIVDLAKSRKKSTFIPILSFINGTLSSAAQDTSAFYKRDGALFLLGSMSRVLMASDFKQQLETVICSFVLPELSSPHGFMRLRACWTLEQFEDTEYSEATCLKALEGVLNCLNDKDLPVKVAAAGALGTLLDNETSQRTLPPYLAKIMETVLSLANEIQLDSIAFVLERLVQMFSEDLAPYAVQLCQQLRDTVARSLEGYKNVLELDDEDNFGQNTEKMMAVVGMIKAIDTLIDSMAKTPELLGPLEETVLPLVALVLQNRVIDVYEEIFELIDSISFHRKYISPSLWNLLPYIHLAFKDVGSDYIQDMQTTLDNMISYGSETLLSTPGYLEMILEIIHITMVGDDSFSSYDKVYGCKLMESLMLNCRGKIDIHVPSFIKYAVMVLKEGEEEEEKISVLVHHLEVIINAIYYNPLIALNSLQEYQWIGQFFEMWFKKASKFTRVHDKRLIIMSLSSIFSLPFNSLPPILTSNLHHMMAIYIEAVQTLPKALEQRKKLEEEDVSDSDLESNFASDEDYDEINDDEAGEEESWNHSRTPSGLSVKDLDDDEDEDEEYEWEDSLEEELFFETPLDKVDVAQTVLHCITSFAASQPQTLEAIIAHMTKEQADFIRSSLNS